MPAPEQAYVERELGFCEVEQVACGSGLERIYRFMQTDELCNRPQADLECCKVLPAAVHAHTRRTLRHQFLPVSLDPICKRSCISHSVCFMEPPLLAFLDGCVLQNAYSLPQSLIQRPARVLVLLI